MSSRFKLNASPAAVLLMALVFFFDTSGLISAFVPAVLAHELGHFLFLKVFHRRVTRLYLGFAGLEMDYAPRLEGAGSLLCAAAGPFFGGIYALIACSLPGDFWLVSGAASFVLTVFNLLPVLPLDGGRILLALVPAPAARIISLIAAVLMLICGAITLVRYHTPVLILASLWLALCNCSCFFQSADIE